MNWLSNNWIWVALALGFVAFHFFGHRHGGHGHRGYDADAGTDSRSSSPNVGSDSKRSDEHPPHQHHRC
jgi:hypothetical protein